MAAAPRVLWQLVDRFDPSAFDAPGMNAFRRGRVALEAGFRHRDRVVRIVGLAPALAWFARASGRRW